mmetsp:Transcript_31372/g.100114  ORF Transcript_31372/g.100114 Transcript_31372/m.100114 type:complete len:147 (-) Transcript_31372:43-483(-)|eukprot:CAMPEP_0182914080 /NCGR_PEP_ID=MMETSP0034_2-20130328/38367_1 /TAXON_ID=156128 /ORGANISM="Nephroselmis pyriformis, Strain CCMP717" /LENGTH=146 /DNA_ID=CAMNT_0025050813 /DNA_START=258 /DNA_END=698 /DNA_ORIENTATION=-
MGGFACFTCGAGSLLPAAGVERLRREMDGARAAFPAAVSCFILDPQGKLVAHGGADESVPAAIMQQVSAVKRSTMQLGAEMGGRGCPAVHIRGNSHVLSCYDVGPSVLAVLSREHATSVEVLDTAAADARMEGVVAALRETLGDAV